MRAVLDTNVLVSAFLHHDRPPGRLVALSFEGAYTLVLSPAILGELRRVIGRPKVLRYLQLSREAIEARIIELEIQAELVEGTLDLDVEIRDPDDRMLLVAAVEGRAGFLVTGDDDLLRLGNYEEVEIMTPRAFLARLEVEE